MLLKEFGEIKFAVATGLTVGIPELQTQDL